MLDMNKNALALQKTFLEKKNEPDVISPNSLQRNVSNKKVTNPMSPNSPSKKLSKTFTDIQEEKIE